MNCGQVEEQLSAYLDDMLAPQERREITFHVQTCSHCMMSLAELRQNDILVARLPRISPHPALAGRLFSCPEMLELTGTMHNHAPLFDEWTRPLAPRHQGRRENHPYLVALPGGRSSQIQNTMIPPTPPTIPLHPTQPDSPPRARKLFTPLHIAIAALLLLALSLALLFRLYAHHHRQRAEQQPGQSVHVTGNGQQPRLDARIFPTTDRLAPR